MSIITIEKARDTDAEQLTAILKRTFDEEANKWLPQPLKVPKYKFKKCPICRFKSI